VLWRSKAAPTTGNASAQSSPTDQLRASDPAGFYAPYTSADNFISQFGGLFAGTNPLSGFRAQIAERDGLGITHVRYRQHLGGVPVFGAEVVVHPECAEDICDAADAVLSTSQMIRYCQQSSTQTFIIGTEMGLMHRLHKLMPEKTLSRLPRRSFAPT